MKEFIDKLIERLEDKIEVTWEHDYLGGRKDAFKEAIEIVNQLAEEYINCSTDISTKSTDCSTKVSEMPTGWIPCSERLPKQNEEVLATILLKGKPMVLIINYDHTWLDDGLSKLIAWMPLPAPYTEGE